jgi:hypothetical protein
MPTLTEVGYYTRRSVIYGGIGLVSLIILVISWRVFSSWWIQQHPPAPPSPTKSFGTLPSLVFPDGIDPASLNLRLETISGTTPDLGSQARVYFMPAFRPNVLGLQLATEMAQKQGFIYAPTRIDEQLYEWNREGVLPGKLTVNLITGHFSLTTQWHRDVEISTSRSFSQTQVVTTARNYLRSAGLLPPDLENGPTIVDYLQAGEGTFTPAISQSEANFARVHLFRAHINEIPVVTSNPNEALVQVTVSGASPGKQIVEIQYRYSPIELGRSATYPLLATQDAWQLLQTQPGYIANILEGTTSSVIRQVELGYYDSSTPQQFLQPVYIFRGDNDFIGYFPAVSQD